MEAVAPVGTRPALRRARALPAVLAVAAVALASACSPTTEVDGSTSGADTYSDIVGPFDQEIARVIEEATEQGASAAQLAELEQAAAAGEVDLDTARAATRRTVECIVGQGFDAVYAEQAAASGVTTPGFTLSADSEEDAYAASDAAEACETRESLWVSMMFSMQPSSLSAQEEYLRQQLPIVIACLEDEGIAASEDDALFDTLNKAVSLISSSEGQINCLEEADISSF